MALSDDERARYGRRVLRRLGAPRTPENLRAWVAWTHAEGGHDNGATWNLVNTTQNMPGAGNTGTQGNIKVYRSEQQGVDATVKTLQNGNYNDVIAAFQRGNDASAVGRAIGASKWGTEGAFLQRVIDSTPLRHGLGKDPTAGPRVTLPRPTVPASSLTVPASSLTVPQASTSATGGGGIDQAAFDDAKRKQLLATLLSKGGRGNSLLFKTGLLSTRPVSAADFQLPAAAPTAPAATTTTTTSSAPPMQADQGDPTRGGQSGTAIAAAIKRLGVKEVNGNNRGPDVDKLEKGFGMVGQPWCGIFVGTVLREAGVKGIDSRVASVSEIETMAKNGQGGFASWHSTRDAREGDALVTRQGQHVAFVESVDRDKNGHVTRINVVGGNQGAGDVSRRSWTPDQVFGVARPRYSHR